MKTSDEHELEAVRQLDALSDERVAPSPRERIAIAQAHATMAMASAIAELASVLHRAGRRIR